MINFNRFVVTPATRAALDLALILPVVLLTLTIFVPSVSPALGLPVA